MKKHLFPIVAIAAICALSFGSCKKKSSNTCTCKEKGVSGQDTTVSTSTVDTPYTSLSQECTVADAFVKAALGSVYGCHM
jgi:hypothetical protein